MLTEYFDAAMRQAKYEILPDTGEFYGEIPICQGVWASNVTLEGCRTELREVLEEWVLFSIHRHRSLPIIDGIDLSMKEIVA